MRRIHLLLPLALVALGGCDPSGPRVGPPAEVAMSALPQDIRAGGTITGITLTVTDREGRPVPGAEVEWAPARGSVPSATGRTNDDGIARTDWTVGTTTGSQALRARVGSLEAIRTVSVTPGPLAEVALAPASLSFDAVGDTAILAATGTDEYGNAVSIPAVTWTSSAGAVVTVQNGVVVSRGPGSAQITAEAAGVSGSAPVTVTQVLTGLRISPAAPVMVLDEALQLAAVPVDARGSAVDTSFTVTWSSSDPAVASIDQDGRLESREQGTTVVTASGGGYSDETTVEVRDGVRPVITEISPATLTPGDTATITGTAFSATASQNEVTVGGVAVTVVSATPTRLRIAMPVLGVFPCGPTAVREVRVSVGGLVTSAQHPVAGAARRELGIGESVALHGSGVACNELTGGGTYLLSVFNTSLSPTAQTAFRLRGTAPEELGPDRLAAPGPVERIEFRPPALQPDPAAEAHHRILEENNRVLRALTAAAPRRAPALPLAAVAQPVAIGDTRTFRMPDVDASGSLCTTFFVITARATFVGDHAVIWEDQAAPLAGQMDGRWQEVGREYEAVMHPIILEYFGDPQAYDPWLENQGRVHMLFSRRVNDFERGINGFVFSGDFFPVSQCAQSNQAPIFYGRAPTEPGSGYTGYTADTWAWGMRATIIHEVKHIVSYAKKLRLWRDGASPSVNYEVVWLEEATARLAEEFYARALSGYGQGDNVTYQQSIWCERRVGTNHPQCDPIPNMIYKHFGAVYQYYANVESLSPLGPAVARDWTFYGSGWLLVRWAMDHAGTSEQAFSRALVDEPSLSGAANLAERMARPFSGMLADFTLAMLVDEHPSGVRTRPELTFPSWNTRDIMKGLHEDHQNTSLADVYTVPWPLPTRDLGFGSFDRSVAGIRGGTATFFRLTGGPGQHQLLELLSSGGITAPANLGLAIVRIQ
jgi:hypothetical protein